MKDVSVKGPNRDSRVVSISIRVYRLLLRAYPRDFQKSYAAHMAQVFGDVSRTVYSRRGLVGLAVWWGLTAADLISTVIEQYRTEEMIMSKSALAQQAGNLLIAGGVCCAISSLIQPFPESKTGVLWVLVLFIFPAYLLIVLASMGLAKRYGNAIGRSGRLLLYLSCIGAVILILGLGLIAVLDVYYILVIIGLGIHVLSMFLLTLIQLRKDALPVSAWWLLLISLLPLLPILSIFNTPTSDDPDYGTFLYMIGTAAAWVMIGIAVRKDELHRHPEAQIQP